LLILQGNSCSITQESGEIWTDQTDLQQIYPKSDRLLYRNKEESIQVDVASVRSGKITGKNSYELELVFMREIMKILHGYSQGSTPVTAKYPPSHDRALHEWSGAERSGRPVLKHRRTHSSSVRDP